MQYIINYPYYNVYIRENEGLYKYLFRNLGIQFPMSETESVLETSPTSWLIEFSQGLIMKYRKKCIHHLKMEHNLDCFYCQSDEFSLYMSLTYEWIIQLFYNNTIYVEVDSAMTAYFIIRKILHQISRYENHIKKHVLLHASCLVKNNQGYVFMGEKGMGKTTVMMNLLVNFEGEYKYLGNDITVLDKQLLLYAIYSKVGIGAATIDFINQEKYNKYPIYDKNKYYYDLGEFSECFRIEYVNTARLSAIFILCNSDSETFSCSMCDPSIAAQKLCTNILLDGKHDELSDHPDWLNLRGSEFSIIDIDSICRKITEEIPCYLINYRLSRRNDYYEINKLIHMISEG